MREKIKITFSIIGIIIFFYIWSSQKALNVVINLFDLAWGVVFILSILVFLPISFINVTKKWCSYWFNGIAILLFILVILKVKYLMIVSGNDSFDSSFIDFFISLFRATLGAGFSVYWPLLMTLAWGYGSMWFAERLEKQYINYEANQRNNTASNSKKKTVIATLFTVLFLMVLTTVFIQNKRNQNTKVKSVIVNTMSEYKVSGMTGLKNLSQSNYDKLGEKLKLSEIQECAWVDTFAIILNDEIATKLGFPKDEYFNSANFRKRIKKYLLEQKVSDEKANEYVNGWTDEVIDALEELEKNNEIK